MDKIVIYQIFTRLFGNRNQTRKANGTIEENGCGKMSYFDKKVLKQLKDKGFTHLWYTGIVRHASQTDYSAHGIPNCHPAVVKGRAGSPYAITDYYDVDPDLADDVDNRMAEFEALVERTHKAGLKVITDFVPNHVARQYHSICKPEGVKDFGEDDDTTKGFSPQNNFYYCPGHKLEPCFYTKENGVSYVEFPAKATGNDHFGNRPSMTDWYETVKLNYGVDYYAGRFGFFDPIPDTWQKMLDILLFWAGKGIDGFRCDMAEMVPAEFWSWALSQLKEKYPNIIIIGEVYNPDDYRRYLATGFDYLYDKVGMYDCLRDVTCGHRSATNITSQWQFVDDILDHMLYFLENHDEQRIASDFYIGDGRNAIPAMIVAALMQRCPLMIYAGQEYGERGMDEEGFSGKDGRTTIFDYWSVDTICRAGLGNEKNQLTNEEKALEKSYKRIIAAAKLPLFAEGLSFDLMYVNPHSDHFNPDCNFAFMRKYKDEAALVVVNFDGEEREVGVRIAGYAIDFLKLEKRKYEAVDLNLGDKTEMDIYKDCVVTMKIPANSARIWVLR